MSSLPESTNSENIQLVLSGRQKALFQQLLKKSEELANYYLGAVYAFNQKNNPDYLAHSAHGLRELIEKLPQIVGIVPNKPDVSGKFSQLASKWVNQALKSDCYSGEVFSGDIDDKLLRFLNEAKKIFQWFEERPSRRDDQVRTLRALDPVEVSMPESLEKVRTDELTVYGRYFTSVSHHSRQTDDNEFSSFLVRVEIFILDYLSPRTFDDHEELDALIRAGEENA